MIIVIIMMCGVSGNSTTQIGYSMTKPEYDSRNEVTMLNADIVPYSIEGVEALPTVIPET